MASASSSSTDTEECAASRAVPGCRSVSVHVPIAALFVVSGSFGSGSFDSAVVAVNGRLSGTRWWWCAPESKYVFSASVVPASDARRNALRCRTARAALNAAREMNSSGGNLPTHRYRDTHADDTHNETVDAHGARPRHMPRRTSIIAAARHGTYSAARQYATSFDESASFMHHLRTSFCSRSDK
jgi:hypothetical protein